MTKREEKSRSGNSGGGSEASSNSPFRSNVEAAGFLGLSPKTLEKYRIIGGGPRFYKLGRRVVYKTADLTEWAEARVRTSTCDDGNHH